MSTMAQGFFASTAAHLMSRDLVLIPPEMSLRMAAHLLSQAGISGAPVVDNSGRCIGVLSATDFVHWAEKQGSIADTGPRANRPLRSNSRRNPLPSPTCVPNFRSEMEAQGGGVGVYCACAEWQVMEVEELPVEEVRQFMTPDPVTVAPSTPIVDLARIMMDAHIHRVIVVNHEGHPIGVVTSTDILAAVASAGAHRAG